MSVYNELGRNADGTFQYDEERLIASAAALDKNASELHNAMVRLQTILTNVKTAWNSTGADGESYKVALQKTIDTIDHKIVTIVKQYGQTMDTLVSNGKEIASKAYKE